MAIEPDSPSESKMEKQSENSERIYCNKCRRKTLHRLLKTTRDERIEEDGEGMWEPENLRLPMMGARTLVDMMILEKIGDVGGFKEKLGELEKEGFISSRSREMLYAALEVGNAAVHRGHAATKSKVQDVMDIVESM